MALWTKGRTEHSGHKGSSRKHGFWGKRDEAKEASRKQRRRDDKDLERDRGN